MTQRGDDTVGWLAEDDVETLLLGATLLGSGGGGEAEAWAHQVRAALGGGLELLSLAEADRRGIRRVAAVGMIGATTVLIEKLPHGGEIVQAVAAAQRWHGSSIEAVMPSEAAGLNAALAVTAAAQLGLPLIDADLMGRALPRFDQLSLVAAGAGVITAAALASTGGEVLVLDEVGPAMLERAVRSYVAVAGGWAGSAFGPLAIEDLEGRCCEGTLDRAVRLGRSLQSLLERGGAEPPAIAEALDGVFLGAGRVVDVARGTVGTPNRASFAVADRSGPVLRIEAENEYLVVFVDGEVAVTCPDLIVVLDRRTARPISVERLRFGDDVQVLALPGPTWWWDSDDRLAAVGPRAFGIELDPARLGNAIRLGDRAGAVRETLRR